MSHELRAKDNMFSVNEVPWHKLGVVLNAAPDVKQAIAASGLGWEVGTKPLFTAEGETAPALATFRKDDNTILGVVGTGYKPLQNVEAFEFFQPFLDSKEASLETAGSLKDGRRVWVLAKINRADSVIVPKADDRISKYVLLSNSHDGTMAIRVGFTPIRVVCNNTLTLAHDSENSSLIRVFHRGNITKNLEEVRKVMDTANSQFEATAEQYKYLASKAISEADLEKFVKIVFATNKQQKEAASPEELNSGNRVIEDIKTLFTSGQGNDLPGVAGTYWAAYNAITEFVQYRRGKDEAGRLDQTWFGTGMTLNKKALKTALVMAT